MKWTYLTLAALVSVATACVVDLENRVTCPTRTISNITANFDNRPKNTTLNEYRHLNYNNISVENQGPLGIYRRGVVPHSEPHYAIAYPPNPLATDLNIPGVTLSLDGTRTTSFDFHGVYVACLDLFNIRSGYEAQSCNISIDCATYLSFEGHLGPQMFEYTVCDTCEWDAPMMLMQPTGYEYCQEVTIDFWGENPGATVIVIDDVNYTIREGECIPGSPLAPNCPSPVKKRGWSRIWGRDE